MRIRHLLFFTAVVAPGCWAQRLPVNAVPSHYALQLAPDLKSAAFSGTETIDVQLHSPSTTVTLNSLELKIAHVSAKTGTRSVEGKVTYDPAKEQATLTFPEPLPAHEPVQLAIEYTGVLNDQLRGFYLSKTAKRSYAVTQFESTDARRAFPSFDEPALKATFDVALTVDANDSVIANGMQVSDKPAGTGKHTLTFATTPKMSTYLVAFQVGDFQCIHGSADGVAIGVCTPPSELPLASTALKDAEHFLHYYNQYFGIKYPLPKLDMVAIPDFEAGAMENFGCITYRETDLLVDAKRASLPQRKRVAIVVAHEMAHQWFGDLVTMQWWNSLWLNEGFATWMETKAVEEFHPDWGLAEDRASALNQVMDLDSAPTTRSVQSPADTPAQINEQFDSLSYQKAGAVLDMVENYVGADPFRIGVQRYLQAHLYGNATSEDFWNTQTATSGKPVDKVMRGFVTQPGVPLLTFASVQGGHVQVKQSRFFLQSPPTAQSWTVPVCPSGACQLAQGSQSVVATAHDEWMNTGEHGYFRSAYDAPTLHAIDMAAETSLTVPERIGLYGDDWAQVQSGMLSIGEMLSLAERLRSDQNSSVLRAVRNSLVATRDQIATDAQRPLFLAWLRKTYGPTYASLPMRKPGEEDVSAELRAELFDLLGFAGDPQVLHEASTIANQFLQGEHSADPEEEGWALKIAAMHGDADLFSRMQAYYGASTNPQQKEDILDALAYFTDPALVKRALDFAVSGQVSKQDSAALISTMLSRHVTRDRTWAYIQSNWPAISAQFTTTSGGYVVYAAGSFCSKEAQADVSSFFTAHPVPAAERALKFTLERIDGCVRLHDLQQPAFASWLQNQ